MTGPDLALGEAIIRILLVLVLAGAVGVERELREQEAGLRTHMLVGVGAALFVMVGNFAWGGLRFGNEEGVVLDPSRVVAYVVTGVGFLGAGTIIKNGGSIRGLTTAASLWVVAAFGVAVGAGEYALAIFATVVVLTSLWPVRQVARLLGLRRQRSKRLALILEPGTSIAGLVELLERGDVELQSTSLHEEALARRFEVAVAGREAALVAALDDLSRAPGVRNASLSG